MINVPGGTLNDKKLTFTEVRCSCGEYFITCNNVKVCRDCELKGDINAN